MQKVGLRHSNQYVLNRNQHIGFFDFGGDGRVTLQPDQDSLFPHRYPFSHLPTDRIHMYIQQNHNFVEFLRDTRQSEGSRGIAHQPDEYLFA